MSFHHMAWAVDQKLPALRKIVLLMLSSHTNGHTNRCDPSLSRLAEECGMSKDSVIRAIKSLEADGMLKIEHRYSDGVQIRNAYRLTMNQVVADSDRGVQAEGEVVADSDRGSRSQRLGVVADSDRKQEVESRSKTKPLTPASPALFDRFWNAYPKKVARPAAMKAFKKINPSEDLVEKMVSALAEQKKSKQWTKDGGEYVPNPSTWLNQERWEDNALEDTKKELVEKHKSQYKGGV